MTKVFLIIIVLVAGAVAFFGVMDRRFYSSFTKRAMEVKAEAGAQAGTLITEEDLAGLPEPMARYMRFTGVAGKKPISFLHLKHSGKFKTGVGKPFSDIRGEYYITTKKPSFCWFGKINMAPGLSVSAFDSYFNGKGRMFVKILSAFTVVDAQSKETDNSAFGRCVAELTMAPTFFLNKDIAWKLTGKDSVKCAVSDAGMTAEAEFYVNPDGSLEKAVVMRNYDRGNGKSTLEKFVAVASGYKEQSGFVLPTKLDGYWDLKEGEFHYVSFEIGEMEIE